MVGAKSNTIRAEVPIPTNMKFPSVETSRPLGPATGFRLFAREAQHWPPLNPPKWPLGPMKPGRRRPLVLQPNRVKLPCALVSGGIVSPVAASTQHGLALTPASATELSPPTAHNAMLETVLNSGTS